jgi:hypothetical protein
MQKPVFRIIFRPYLIWSLSCKTFRKKYKEERFLKSLQSLKKVKFWWNLSKIKIFQKFCRISQRSHLHFIWKILKLMFDYVLVLNFLKVHKNEFSILLVSTHFVRPYTERILRQKMFFRMFFKKQNQLVHLFWFF